MRSPGRNGPSTSVAPRASDTSREIDFKKIQKVLTSFKDHNIKLKYARTGYMSQDEMLKALPGAYALQREAYGQSGSVIGTPRPQLTSDAEGAEQFAKNAQTILQR